jgi:type I restriction enzyme R subunit
MATTDTTEKGLESLIVRHLTGQPPAQAVPTDTVQAGAGHYAVGTYVQGAPADYNRDLALDVPKLLAFLQDTQPKPFAALGLAEEGTKRTQFLHRLQGEIAKRGVVDVLRKGVSHGPAHMDLYKVLPTPTDPASTENFKKNVFSVTRQLRYSNDEAQRSLDMVIFLNGLPLITFELKNSLTKQTVLHGALRGGRRRGALLHAPDGQEFVVPALQQGPQRRRRQPAQPAGPEDRLSVETGAGQGVAGQHHRDLRPGR